MCPRCGSGADVRTVGELFAMMNGMQDDALRQAQQERWQDQAQRSRGSRPYTDPAAYALGQEIANTVLGAASRFLGRDIGKRRRPTFGERIQQTFEDRVGPVLDARLGQSRQDQAAIVERYPELRGCLRDEVIFLDGGSRWVPISDIRMPVTLAAADELVSRLRAP